MDEIKKRFWLKWDKIEDEDEKIKFLKTIPSLSCIDDKILKKFMYVLDDAIEINQRAYFY